MATSRRRVPPESFRAYCFNTDAVGDVVYIMGPKVGQLYQVTGADIDDISKMPAIGVLTQKSAATECLVQTSGLLVGLFSGLTPGRPLFIGTDSRPTHTVPAPLVGRRWQQGIGTALSATDILINIVIPIGIRP